MRLYMWVQADEFAKRPDEIEIQLDEETINMVLNKIYKEILKEGLQPSTLTFRGKILLSSFLSEETGRAEVVRFMSQEG